MPDTHGGESPADYLSRRKVQLPRGSSYEPAPTAWPPPSPDVVSKLGEGGGELIAQGEQSSTVERREVTGE